MEENGEENIKIHSFVGDKEDLKLTYNKSKDEQHTMSPKSMCPPPMHPHRRSLNLIRPIEPPLRNGSRKRRSLQHWLFSGEVREGVDPLRSGGLSELPHLTSVNLIDVGFIIPSLDESTNANKMI